MPDGPAAEIGLRPGDILLKLDRTAVNSRTDFRRVVTRLRGRGRALLLVQRGRKGYQVTIALS